MASLESNSRSPPGPQFPFTANDIPTGPRGLPLIPDKVGNNYGTETGLIQQNIIRSFLNAHYTLATGGIAKTVPFTTISQNPFDYIQRHDLPRHIAFKDPAKYKVEETHLILELWRNRQRQDQIPFQFIGVKGKNQVDMPNYPEDIFLNMQPPPTRLTKSTVGKSRSTVISLRQDASKTSSSESTHPSDNVQLTVSSSSDGSDTDHSRGMSITSLSRSAVDIDTVSNFTGYTAPPASANGLATPRRTPRGPAIDAEQGGAATDTNIITPRGATSPNKHGTPRGPAGYKPRGPASEDVIATPPGPATHRRNPSPPGPAMASTFIRPRGADNPASPASGNVTAVPRGSASGTAVTTPRGSASGTAGPTPRGSASGNPGPTPRGSASGTSWPTPPGPGNPKRNEPPPGPAAASLFIETRGPAGYALRARSHVAHPVTSTPVGQRLTAETPSPRTVNSSPTVIGSSPLKHMTTRAQQLATPGPSESEIHQQVKQKGKGKAKSTLRSTEVVSQGRSGAGTRAAAKKKVRTS